MSPLLSGWTNRFAAFFRTAPPLPWKCAPRCSSILTPVPRISFCPVSPPFFSSTSPRFSPLPPLSRHRFFRALPDSHLHALRLSGSYPRQRSDSCVSFSALSFCFSFHRHSRFQQSQFAVGGHSARLPHLSPQYLFLRLHLSARDHARHLLRHQLFHSRKLLHQHHPRHHPPRRRTLSSLARWPGSLRYRLHPSSHCRPPFTE